MRPRLEANRQARAEREAADWNERHPAGTPVRYWPGAREGEGRQGVTRDEASTLCGIAVVWIKGHAGCVALSHVEAIEAAAGASS